MYTRDVSQAYVCSKFELLRDVYVVPPKEANCSPDVLWLLLKPLYGLPESGALWYETYFEHNSSQLGLTSTVFDPFLWYRHTASAAPLSLPDQYTQQFRKGASLDGILSLQVDDSIGAGSADFLANEESAAVAFPTKGRNMIQTKSASFNGSEIFRSTSGAYHMHQRQYVTDLPAPKTPRNPAAFATVRGKMAYASNNTRVDVTCAVNQLSQVIAGKATEADFKRLDSCLERLHNNDLVLNFPALDIESLELRVYADSSFANNEDLSSQIGYVVFLCDKHDNCALVSWCSKKSRRVTRSVMAAELFALSAAYDIEYSIRHTLSTLLQRTVEMRLYTDSQSLWDALTSLSPLTEKRLCIDISGLRQAFRTGNLRHLCRIDSRYNPADPMTKVLSESYLDEVLASGKLSHPVQRYLFHGHTKTSSSESA